jgi:hypothetical protein
MWTAIWTLPVFVLLLFHGYSIPAFPAEPLRERRAHRLQIEQERTKQTLIDYDRDALVWRERELELEQASGSRQERKTIDVLRPSGPADPEPRAGPHRGGVVTFR